MHVFAVLMVTNRFVVLTLFSFVIPTGVSLDKSTVSYNSVDCINESFADYFQPPLRNFVTIFSYEYYFPDLRKKELFRKICNILISKYGLISFPIWDSKLTSSPVKQYLQFYLNQNFSRFI